jgi:hypothetical protein
MGLSVLRVLLLALLAGPACAARLQAPAPQESQEPNLSAQEMKQFLRTAKVINFKHTSKGITAPWRLTLSDGKITHEASFQSIDEYKSRQEFPDGHSELNFRDCYKYDIAAYELAVLIGLGDMMPVTVERRWRGNPGAISWWLPAKMDVGEMTKKKISPPDPDAYNRQMYKKRVFAELVYDSDPNLTNVLISADWHLWMIDFTRAFRLNRELYQKKDITESKCERRLLERLRKLDSNEVAQATKGFLTKTEVEAVMARRDIIVGMFTDMIAQKGESQVLYDDPVAK